MNLKKIKVAAYSSDVFLIFFFVAQPVLSNLSLPIALRKGIFWLWLLLLPHVVNVFKLISFLLIAIKGGLLCIVIWQPMLALWSIKIAVTILPRLLLMLSGSLKVALTGVELAGVHLLLSTATPILVVFVAVLVLLRIPMRGVVSWKLFLHVLRHVCSWINFAVPDFLWLAFVT